MGIAGGVTVRTQMQDLEGEKTIVAEMVVVVAVSGDGEEDEERHLGLCQALVAVFVAGDSFSLSHCLTVFCC